MRGIVSKEIAIALQFGGDSGDRMKPIDGADDHSPLLDFLHELASVDIVFFGLDYFWNFLHIDTNVVNGDQNVASIVYHPHKSTLQVDLVGVK